MPNSRKEYHAQYWKDHSEKMKARQADWRKENGESFYTLGVMIKYGKYPLKA